MSAECREFVLYMRFMWFGSNWRWKLNIDLSIAFDPIIIIIYLTRLNKSGELLRPSDIQLEHIKNLKFFKLLKRKILK